MTRNVMFLGGTAHKKVLPVDCDRRGNLPHCWQLPVIDSDNDIQNPIPLGGTFDVQNYIARTIVVNGESSTIFVFGGDELIYAYVSALSRKADEPTDTKPHS